MNQPKITPLGPPWQVGDIVRNADTDHAEDVWAYLPDSYGDDCPWRPLTTGDVRWCSRGNLPENLTLLVRGGQVAAP